MALFLNEVGEQVTVLQPRLVLRLLTTKPQLVGCTSAASAAHLAGRNSVMQRRKSSFAYW
jgi:hypothetical protein